MKNLENFGVQELSAKEIKETEGGILTLIAIGLTLMAGAYSFGKDVGGIL